MTKTVGKGKRKGRKEKGGVRACHFLIPFAACRVKWLQQLLGLYTAIQDLCWYEARKQNRKPNEPTSIKFLMALENS